MGVIRKPKQRYLFLLLLLGKVFFSHNIFSLHLASKVKKKSKFVLLKFKETEMKLYETLEQQLKKEPNFVSDNGELKKWII